MNRQTSGDYPLRYLYMTAPSEARQALEQVGVAPYGIEAMEPKMHHRTVLIEGISCPMANILKQEMLSLGGDVAVARGAVACSIPQTDAIIMGTHKQVVRLAEKIMDQPFGLNRIGQRLKDLLDNLSRETWLLKTSRREIVLGERTLIMGILNVTPDSFSDGGCFESPDKAIDQGLRMWDEGADIIDIGGESSRPGAKPVTNEEELSRVVPVIEALAAKISAPLSVDTTKGVVARSAIGAGAEIVNDITAMTGDDGMEDIVASTGAAVVLMHMRGRPPNMQDGDLTYRSVHGDIINFLVQRMEAACRAGVRNDSIMVDPGLGFGKTGADNLKLLNHLNEFKSLGRPIVTGASRKSFIGAIMGGKPHQRLEGTAAAVTAAILKGSQIVRVHDVPFMKKVAAMADAIVKA
jgi:dihydropteroate synthase